jgi:hypothetical protein
MLGLVLALALQEPTVALVSGWPDQRVRIVTVTEAESLLKSDDPSLRAAAEIALGTRVTQSTPVVLSPQDRERKRWQRQPLQKPIP